MLAWIVGLSLKFRRLVVPLAVAIIVLGVTQWGQIDRDALPEFSPTIVEVQTEALGLSAEEVEQLVTSPLEQDLLNGVAFLDKIESASLPGLSSVVLTFEAGTDVLDARQVVNERLTQAVGAAGLPQVASLPQMIQPLSSASRVAMISLTSDSMTPIEMSVVARWLISPSLLGVEGVANVSIWGFRDRQLQVLVDPDVLAEQDVALSQVIRTAGNALEVSPLSFLEASSPGTGGFIDTANQRLHVFHEQAISDPAELGRVPLEGPNQEVLVRNGQPVTLADVTTIVEDHQPLIGDAHCAAGPCLLLVLDKFPDQNTPQVVAAIDTALDDLRPGLAGLTMDSSIYEPAEYIESSMRNVAVAAIAGLVLALIVLMLFLDWRAVSVAAFTAASAAGAAIVALWIADVSINTMIVAGLVLGLVVIVDDAVSSATSVHSEQRSAAGGNARLALWQSTLENRRVALYGTMIVLSAVVPLLFIRGEGGAFLPSVAGGYLLGAAAGFLAAVIVAPAISRMVYDTSASGDGIDDQDRPLVRRGAAIFERTRVFVQGMIGRTGAAVVVVVALIGAGLVSAAFVDSSMRPDLEERDLIVEVDALEGTSLDAMSETSRQLLDDLAALPGVADANAHVGRAITSDQVVNVNSAEVWLRLSADAPYAQTVDQIGEVLADYDTIQTRITTYSDARVSELIGDETQGLVVRVFGDGGPSLAPTAIQVAAALEEVTGVGAATIVDTPLEDTVEIKVDIDRAQAVGLKPGDVRRETAVLLSGITVGNLFEEQKVFDVVVWGDPSIRATVDDVRNLPIRTPSGSVVRLSEVADVTRAPNPAIIRHDSVSPFVDVALTVADGSSEGEVSAAVRTALSEEELTFGLHAEILGGASAAQAERNLVIWLVVAALAVAYLMFQAGLGSWRLAALAALSIPTAIAAAVVALAVFGGALTVGALIGIVAGVGLAARATLLLMRRAQALFRHGTPFGAQLVEGAVSETLPTIVLTTLAVIALALPAAMGIGAGTEVVQPAAIATIGGALGSLLFVLIALPVLYTRWGRVEIDTDDDLFALIDVDSRQVQG